MRVVLCWAAGASSYMGRAMSLRVLHWASGLMPEAGRCACCMLALPASYASGTLHRSSMVGSAARPGVGRCRGAGEGWRARGCGPHRGIHANRHSRISKARGGVRISSHCSRQGLPGAHLCAAQLAHKQLAVHAAPAPAHAPNMAPTLSPAAATHTASHLCFPMLRLTPPSQLIMAPLCLSLHLNPTPHHASMLCSPRGRHGRSEGRRGREMP